MNKLKTFQAYITSYALTKGVELLTVKGPTDGGYVSHQAQPFGRTNYYGKEGKEWHRTWESAKARAEAMRDAKIKSLKKQLAKLEAMTFEEPKP